MLVFGAHLIKMYNLHVHVQNSRKIGVVIPIFREFALTFVLNRPTSI